MQICMSVHVFVERHLKLHSIFDLHKQNLTNDTISMTIIKRNFVCLLTPSQGRRHKNIRLIPIRMSITYPIDYNIDNVGNNYLRIHSN